MIANGQSAPSRALDVAISTWRLGGLDVTLRALAEQTFTDFNVILIDDLHRWRAPAIAGSLAALPFSVTHLPPRKSLFPVACHARALNTAILAGTAPRVVFLCDFAVPPPMFLAEHAALPCNVIGSNPYRVITARDILWALPNIEEQDIWRTIDLARQGKHLWSVFTGIVYPDDVLRQCVERTSPQQPCGWFMGTTPHYCVHFKCDSVDRVALTEVNGHDERFDGQHGYVDVDTAMRIEAAGATVKRLELEVPIIDPAPRMHRLLVNTAQDNVLLLQWSKKMIEGGHYARKFGITVRDDAP